MGINTRGDFPENPSQTKRPQPQAGPEPPPPSPEQWPSEHLRSFAGVSEVSTLSFWACRWNAQSLALEPQKWSFGHPRELPRVFGLPSWSMYRIYQGAWDFEHFNLRIEDGFWAFFVIALHCTHQLISTSCLDSAKHATNRAICLDRLQACVSRGSSASWSSSVLALPHLPLLLLYMFLVFRWPVRVLATSVAPWPPRSLTMFFQGVYL